MGDRDALRQVPGFGGRLLAVDLGRDAALLGILTASSRPSRAALQHAATLAVRIGGTAPLRRTTVAGDRLFGLTPSALTSTIASVVPGFELVGLSVPRQGRRRRVIALGRVGGQVVIAKLDAETGPVEHEGQVLQALGDRTLPAVITPRFVGGGRAETPDGEIALVVQTAVTTRPHRPVTSFGVDRLADAIAELLSDVLGPPSVPAWVPSHGDLAPWNLRRTDRGVALVDWETAGHSPVGTDAAYFAACVTALTGRPMPPIEDVARAHLLGQLAERTDVEDVSLTTALRTALTEAPAR